MSVRNNTFRGNDYWPVEQSVLLDFRLRTHQHAPATPTPRNCSR